MSELIWIEDVYRQFGVDPKDIETIKIPRRKYPDNYAPPDGSNLSQIMPMQSLQQIYDQQIIRSDKGTLHSYTATYEKLFAPYRTRAKNILELGVLGGASILLWEKFFEGKVYGVDITDQPVGGKFDLRPMIADPNHNIFIFDVCNQEQLEKHFKGIKFDVIIEDCEHVISQQFEIYNALKPYIAEGGIYVIEDIQDITANKVLFEAIDPEKKVEIIDLRVENLRYDNVLITITDK